MTNNYPKIKKQFKNKPHRFVQSSADTLVVRFEKNNLKEVTSKQNNSFRLEVVEKQRIGTSGSNFFDPATLSKKALASAQFNEKIDYKFPKKQPLPKVKLYSPKISAIKPQEFIKLGQQLLSGIKEADPNILTNVVISRTITNSALNTSSGFNDQREESEISVYAEGELVTKGDILLIDDYWSWRENNFDLKDFIQGIVDLFKMSQKIVEAPSGQYTVLMAPEVLSNLADFYSTALSAQNVYKKTSKWGDKMGQQVADPRITLIDNPNIDFAPESTDSDDEGLPARPLTLIEKGVLKNFYTNLKYASKLKITPNGRGFGVPAHPILTNMVFTPGDKPLKKIIAGIKNGILVEQVIGGGQDSPYTGDLSLNIHLGFLIKDGVIVGRVKDCLMSGNAFEMMKNSIAEISSETFWHGEGLNIPYISFENITVAAKS